MFANGTFIDGSTAELSVDGPLRPPYAVYCQANFRSGSICSFSLEPRAAVATLGACCLQGLGSPGAAHWRTALSRRILHT